MDSGEQVFVFEEVAKRKERDDCWLLISGKVYDVTQFLEDHPDFEDVGHSDDARNMMKKYYIGEVDSTTVPPSNKIKPQTYSVTQKDDEPGFLFKILQILVPILILGLAFGFQFLGKKEKTEA
ncbi:hypothetical protein ES332_D07G158500v1 [Gossypium tomentosum]|uniref:Cytochrome b5 heme-binding domain-containing protein n=1 Tax=Gossypium tomentosum TaxID=34277 RepID=A0A5D2K876_GOSTO|nr:hypothetical protein ES332_D07G158500v1 [Gossypium tomentosum]